MHSADPILERFDALAADFAEALAGAGDAAGLEEVRVRFLGRKGRLAELMSGVAGLPADVRPAAGRRANELKRDLSDALAAFKARLEADAAAITRRRFDPTMPGRTPWTGSFHPVTLVMDEICDIFTGMGFEVVTGPEVENDFYNFEALNLPPEHPARDMQDTLYITDSILLRTHTSPLQPRTMMQRTPPLAAIAPGKVYRRDSDLTHTPMFHQIEGFLVDEQVTMADLRGTLTCFVQRIFGPGTRVRFRPSFFPFTEPSAEVDISCVLCSGEGTCREGACRVCKTTGWVEILGCGMIDPEVFRAVGYDPEKVSGFAFGLGVERVAMLKYGIGDLRLFFENDLRFLRQFA